MKSRWTTYLALALWAMAMVAFAGNLLLNLLREDNPQVSISAVFFILMFLSQVFVGVLLAIHRPGNPIGWIFLSAALAQMIVGASDAYFDFLATTSGARPDLTLLLWSGAWLWVVAFALPTTFGILLFPTGRLPSQGWRPFAWLTAIWLTLVAASDMLYPGPLDSEGRLPDLLNPTGIHVLSELFDVVRSVNALGIILLTLVCVASLFVRARSATSQERQQLKWFALAASIQILAIAIAIFEQGLASTTVDSETNISDYLFLLGIAALPVAIGIAILRHNLYDIDRLINRSLVYGSLTILLLLSFLGSVFLFQFLLDPLTGGNDLAVAGSTLLVAALFRPIRDRLQRFVDRRFYRRKYDARRTLQTFSVTARDAVRLDELTGGLTDIVARTVQPAHVSIWLPDPTRKDPQL